MQIQSNEGMTRSTIPSQRLSFSTRARFLFLQLIVLIFGGFFAGPALSSDMDPPGARPPAPMNARQLFVEVDAPRAKLRVTLYMPSNGGPFPLVLFNHGAAPIPKRTPPLTDEFITYYFLSRGYAVAAPMMRGFGDSEGGIARVGCDMVKEGGAAAIDLRTILNRVKQEPAIDGSRIIVTGKSMGGWHALAFGATQPPDVKAIVSFAGGIKESDCTTPDQVLISGSAQLGAKTKIKSLWFFGDNDKTFSAPTLHAMFDAYKGAGAPAELVDFGTFQDDAHSTFASAAGLSDWVKALDAFLAKLGLPSGESYAGYLPEPGPASTNFADLKDSTAIPYLNDAQAKAYLAKFLSYPLPRAMAVGVEGASVSWGGFNAAQIALNECSQYTGQCQLYAVDNSVVWPGEQGAPPPTHFAPIQNASAVPFVKPVGQAAYRAFLQLRRPRAFAIAPDGAWGAASGFDPMTTALARCGQGHEGCELYAVDGNVVWPPNSAAKRDEAK